MKNRIGDLIESFEAMPNWDPDERIPPPRHDHSILFKSLARKFQSRAVGETIQGVWIKTGLKQEERKLRAAFAALDVSKIHVAVLGGWGAEGYVVAKDLATKKFVMRILRLRMSRALVFQDRDYSP